MTKHLSIILLLFLTSIAHAQPTLPEAIQKGLAIYEVSGGLDAMAAWLKGSPIENDMSVKMAVTGGLTTIQAAYGKMIGSEPIRIIPVSASYLRAYVLVKFERGPVFFVFDCYKPAKEWQVFFIDFNTKPANALPIDILTGIK